MPILRVRIPLLNFPTVYMPSANGTSEEADKAAQLYPNSGTSSNGNQTYILEYLRVVWNGKWAILGLVCLIGGATYFYYESQPRTYRANAAVLLNEPDRPERMAEFFPTQPSNRVDRELYFLRNSQSFARKVVRRLVTARDSMSPGIGKSLFWAEDGTPRSEDALVSRLRSAVRVHRDAQAVPALKINVKSSHPKEAAVIVNTYAAVYREHLYRSSSARMRATRQFLQKQKQELEEKLASIEDSIDARVRAGEKQGLFSPADSGGSGAGVMGEAQQLTQKISDLRLQKNQVQLDLKMERALLDSAQARLQRIRPKLADRAASTTSAKLQDTHKRIAELENDIQTIRARHETLSAEMRSQIAKMNARVRELREQANRLAEEYVKAALSTDAINPLGEEGGLSTIVNLRQKMTERRVAITRLEARLEVLEKRLASHRASLQQSPDRTLARLQRRKNTTKELFVSLSKSLQRAQVAEESTPEQARIVRRASPPSRPIGPNIWNNVFMAVLLGGIGGGGLVLLYDRIDDTIETTAALEQGGNEVFGVVSEWNVDNDSVVTENGTSRADIVAPFSPAAEDYRRLATNVQLGLPNDVQILTVTSPSPKEGKTTTAVNLAVALSESGRDVLLLDADLRGATLHRTFDVDRAPGLTDQLANLEDDTHILRVGSPAQSSRDTRERDSSTHSNGDASPSRKDEEIQNRIHEAQEGQIGKLGLLAAGTEVPQPSILLQASHIEPLFDALADSWDLILVDTPPALLYDDAFRLAAFSDLVLLVAAAGITRQSGFREVRTRLQDVGPQNVVTLLNRYQRATSPGYDYKYEDYPYASAHKKKTRMDRLANRLNRGIRRIVKG